MHNKSSKPNSGCGGKRQGAGRKKTNRFGAHLRLEPETLSQIDELREIIGGGFTTEKVKRRLVIRYRMSRSDVVILAVSEKYQRLMEERMGRSSLAADPRGLTILKD